MTTTTTDPEHVPGPEPEAMPTAEDKERIKHEAMYADVWQFVSSQIKIWDARRPLRLMLPNEDLDQWVRQRILDELRFTRYQAHWENNAKRLCVRRRAWWEALCCCPEPKGKYHQIAVPADGLVWWLHIDTRVQ